MAGGRAGFQTLLGGFATQTEKEAGAEGKGAFLTHSPFLSFTFLWCAGDDARQIDVFCARLRMPARRQLSLGEAKEHTHTHTSNVVGGN